jgi:hypothetical protein
MNLPATLNPLGDEASKVAAAVAAAQGAEPKPETKPEPKAETTKADVKPEPKAETTKADVKDDLIGDDDELKPDADGIVRMTMKSFMRRVSSMSRANLRKNFGTDNVEEIVAERKELLKLREEKAENEKSKLTEVERLKVEKKEAEERAEKAERGAQARELRSTAREVDATLKTFAKTIVDREYVDILLIKLAREADKHDDIKTPRQAMKWMEDYVKDHPKLARGVADKTDVNVDDKKAKDKSDKKKDDKKEPEKEPRRVPITNGIRTLKPVPAGAQDTPVLGKMSKDEIYKQTGLKL